MIKIDFLAGYDYAGMMRHELADVEKVEDCSWLPIAINSIVKAGHASGQKLDFIRGRKVVSISIGRKVIYGSVYKTDLYLWYNWKKKIITADNAIEEVSKMFA